MITHTESIWDVSHKSANKIYICNTGYDKLQDSFLASQITIVLMKTFITLTVGN